jgi:hypothetical protein
MKILIIVSIAVALLFWWVFLRNPRPEISPMEIDENDPLGKILILWLKKRFKMQ